MRTLTILLFAIATTTLELTSFAALTVNTSAVQARVGFGSQTVEQLLGGNDSSGLNATAQALHAPLYSSTTVGTASINGDSAIFGASFEIFRGGTTTQYDSRGVRVIAFTPAVTSTYTISAGFTNPLSLGYIYAQLRDLSMLDKTLMEGQDTAQGPASLSLTSATLSEGGLTGQLEAGHEYYWYVVAGTIASPMNDSGISSDNPAYGETLLTIAPFAAVPEPASAAIWSFLALAFASISWCRRRSR